LVWVAISSSNRTVPYVRFAVGDTNANDGGEGALFDKKLGRQNDVLLKDANNDYKEKEVGLVWFVHSKNDQNLTEHLNLRCPEF